MKIILYGNCSYPFFYKELLRQAAEQKTSLEWRVLIYSWRHLPLIAGLLPKEHIFYVPDEINRRMLQPMPDLAVLADYPASLIKDITADKNIPGQLRRFSRDYQIHSAVAYYQLYKEYLQREKPEAVVFPVIESHEGMHLYAAARELGIRTIFVSSARNLHVSFFSETPNEALPGYAFKPILPNVYEQAKRIVEDFDRNPAKAVEFTYDPKPEELVEFRPWLPVRKKLSRLPIGLWNLYQDVKREPHAARPNPLWFQPYMQFWWLNNKIAAWKAVRRRRFNDIFNLAALPKKFVYFPLHVYPELTITTMAPFFEDQLRAIDLMRYSMPPDHLLVIKEHPAMLGRRPLRFYQALEHKAGVLLAAQTLPSIELIRRAALTISVTGTACLEAMFLGKPSFTLEKTFFSTWVPTFDSYPRLQDDVAKQIGTPKEEIKRRAVECVAHMLNIGYDFMLWDPHNPDVDPKFTMNTRNVRQFISALESHLRRLHES